MKSEFQSQIKSVLGNYAGKPGVTRRQFMERAAAMGIGVAAASSVWTKTADAAPKKGGHLIIGAGHGETSDTLNTAIVGNAHVDTFRTGMLRNQLVDVGADGDLEADLATEWVASNGGTRWTFTLRQGVEFHNGKSMTQQDVIDSINYHRGEDSSSGGKSLMDGVTDIKADGSDKVVFDLSSPNADFPFYLSQYFFAIVPSKDGVPDMTSGVGTGPFVLEEFDPGVRAVGRRYENYYKGDKPYVDSAELLSIRDTAARMNAIRTGEVHIIDNVELRTIDRFVAAGGISILDVPGGSNITMPMHADKAPFDNVDVRRAMKYAIDRVELRDKIFSGYASLGNDHPIASFDRFHNSDIPQRAFDPDKAKHHLKQAGLDSVDVTLHASDAAFAGSVDAAQLYAENTKKAGINVKVQREPTDGYWSNVWAKVPFCYSYWNARPTPDLILSLAYAGDAAWGDTNWKNDRFDKILAEARSETDTSKRREMYHELQLILHNDGSTIVPLFQNFVHAAVDKVGHEEHLAGYAPFDGMRAAETMWLKG